MGSAKSNAGVMEIINHALTVSDGKTLLLAQTLKQLSEAILPIFDEYLPRKFVTKWVNTKQEIKIVLSNGHELIGFASENEETFRSMNITAFYLEEASGIKPSVLQECIRRMRNKQGVINGVPHYVGVICSNPAQGFIRDLLFTADHIEGSESIAKTVDMYKKRVTNKNPDLAAFLSSSRDNKYLPPGFIQSVINSLSPEQVRLYVDCIIEYAEGAVYPNFLSLVEEPFEIPKHWVRYIAHDAGINDPAAILLGAIDPETNVIHFYREFYETNKVLSQVAKAFKEMIADIPQGCLQMPIIDPSTNKRSQTTGKSYRQLLQLEHGIITKNGINNIPDGIQRCRDMIYSGQVRFFSTLTNTIKEGCEYRYPTLEERNKNKNLGDVPLDKNNHCLTGDTLIHTTEGLIPIKDLVGKKGQVYCYDEYSKKKKVSDFFDVRKTRENAEIIQIETDKGVIKCTPDHLILTIDGWIAAKDLTEDSLIISIA